ncbi:T9SS type A sorting domain-containing protein [Reichenbachiella ulvae]|uniref:T9SS type A sorting domain-containing protein n=1 Tax=Reichenbachiella ulvae TaxID=2980104 RepID=A0ABT3CS22_9BACT|nr:T9SS type A sorting domain-containing protein [Reichenbachiella ulvae]MCV9386371.1 T9SS type A sorting domain-containing protein [Reichenbachiella ulvae]
MKKSTFLLLISLLPTCLSAQDWASIKSNAVPVVADASSFESPQALPLATLGWEDGLHLSADGLTLYCTYVPLDFLSFALNGSLPNDFSADYDRGAPDFGMDLSTNPIGANEWLHSDVLISERASLSDPFESWTLSNMTRNFYSEGAPTPAVDLSGQVEYMLFTSNDSEGNNQDIWIMETSDSNPTGIGTALPSPINSTYNEDNPHLIRLSDQELILFFDSDNRPGGEGDIDIWYSQSTDNGSSWSDPSNLSSINSAEREHQPFLHQQGSTWHLYYAAYHSDGKLAIFRSIKNGEGWDSWATPELVISSGTAAGIGEPTLSRQGDLSFVVVTEDPNANSSFDHYDSDPWMAKSKTVLNSPITETHSIQLYPNPAQQSINLIATDSDFPVTISSVLGQKVMTVREPKNSLSLAHLPTGIYLLQTQTGETLRLIKD